MKAEEGVIKTCYLCGKKKYTFKSKNKGKRVCAECGYKTEKWEKGLVVD